MKKREFRATVSDKRKVGPRHFLMRLDAKPLAGAVPGQFIMVRVTDTRAPLLRRPFGVHSVDGDVVSILFETVGTATGLLSRACRGDELGIIGPLGSGFSFSRVATRRPVLVAGGMGVAPLYFLAQRLTKRHGRSPLVLIGSRDKASVLREKDFRALGCEVKISTDDGSKGFHGYVTRLLEKTLAPGDEIFACGPKPMLRELCRMAAARRVPAQVSLEAHMSCGFGACLGCAVSTASGYARVCQEGPVFDAKELTWEGT